MSGDPEQGTGQSPGEWWGNAQSVASALSAVGLRNTRQRRWILLTLARLGQSVSPSELYEELRGRRINLVTLYRALALMEAKGLVHRTYLYDGSISYSIARTSRRDYFVTTADRKDSTALSPELAQEAQAAMEAIQRKLVEMGYTDVGHSLVFRATPPVRGRGSVQKN